MLKALFFDFAGVVATDGYYLWVTRHVSDPQLQHILAYEEPYRADRGQISGGEFMERVSARVGRPATEILGEWLSLVEVDSSLVDFICRLRSKYKIALVSNFVHEWLDSIIEKNNLVRCFDEILISSREGVAKPEQEIFRRALTRFGVRADEVIFVDDRQTNLDAARKVGIEGLLYKGCGELCNAFIARGIEVPDLGGGAGL